MTSASTNTISKYRKEYIIKTFLVAEWRMKKLSLDIVACVFQNFKEHWLKVYFKQVF